jgi:hypothetical protein
MKKLLYSVSVTPVTPINGICDYELAASRYSWLIKNVGHRYDDWDHPTEDIYQFINAEDAMQFALLFG